MSIMDRLGRLRPLMGTAEIAAILDMDEKVLRQSLTLPESSNNGVEVYRGGVDKVIDRVSFTGKFTGALPVPGVHIGMDEAEALKALPNLELAPGETGTPNKFGWVRYAGGRTADGFHVSVSMREGKMGGLSLTRSDYAEVQAERQRAEADRAETERRKLDGQNRWKVIADTDEMLESWAAHASPWGESSEKYVAFARWLRAASTPEQRHVVAQTWNWDHTHAPLLWIIRQPDCDIATALTIFFMGSPFFYVQFGDRSGVPAHALEVYDFIAEIRARLDRGFYTRSEIAFDGEAQMASVYRSDADRAAIARIYPRQAGSKFAGRDLSTENNGGGVETPDFDIA